MGQPSPSPDLSGAVLSDHCHLRIPSLPDWIEPTVDYLIRRARQCGAVDASRATRVMLALHEALTNAIVHGNLGIPSGLPEGGDRALAETVAARCADPAYFLREVDIEAEYDGQQARWVFTDRGEGFDYLSALQQAQQTRQSPAESSGGGLVLMRAFVDELRYEEGGRRLVLIVRREHGPQAVRPRAPLMRSVAVASLNGSSLAGQDAGRISPSAQGTDLLRDRPGNGQRVLITIPGEQGRSVSLPAEVRHWHSVGDQVVELGCRLEAPMPVCQPGALPPADQGPAARALHNLVSGLTEQQRPLEERRAAPRVPYSETIRLGLPDGTAVTGFGRDLSRTGIAFFTGQNVPLDVVLLSLPDRNGEGEIQLRARIVRCTRLLDGFHDVAAHFLST